MIIPVRCFTCGKVIGSKWRKYEQLCAATDESERAPTDVSVGGAPKKSKSRSKEDGSGASTSMEERPISPYFDSGHKGHILDKLGLEKLCCRRHVLTHVDLVDVL